MSTTSAETYLPHPQPLIPATLVARPNRFVAHFLLEGGETAEAHCVNPGKMEGLIRPGARAGLLPRTPKPGTRLRYTWELVESEGRWIGAHTTRANALFAFAAREGCLKHILPFETLHAERRLPTGQRIDFVLEGAASSTWVEVKNCHLLYSDGWAYFPDALSKRATHHVRTLVDAHKAGQRCALAFVVQRDDATRLRPSQLHDSVFATACREAADCGVELYLLRFQPSFEGYHWLGLGEVSTAPYDHEALEPERARALRHAGLLRS